MSSISERVGPGGPSCLNVPSLPPSSSEEEIHSFRRCPYGCHESQCVSTRLRRCLHPSKRLLVVDSKLFQYSSPIPTTQCLPLEDLSFVIVFFVPRQPPFPHKPTIQDPLGLNIGSPGSLGGPEGISSLLGPTTKSCLSSPSLSLLAWTPFIWCSLDDPTSDQCLSDEWRHVPLIQGCPPLLSFPPRSAILLSSSDLGSVGQRISNETKVLRSSSYFLCRKVTCFERSLIIILTNFSTT